MAHEFVSHSVAWLGLFPRRRALAKLRLGMVKLLPSVRACLCVRPVFLGTFPCAMRVPCSIQPLTMISPCFCHELAMPCSGHAFAMLLS